MTNACSRWIELSDGAAIGRELSGPERLFLDTHRRACPACAAEQAVWHGLEALMLAPAPREVPVRPAAPRPARLPWAFAASAAAALALGLWLGNDIQKAGPSVPPSGASVPEPVARAVPVAPLGASSVTLETGRLERAGGVVREGAALKVGELLVARAGRACLHLEPGVRACVAQGTVLRVAEANLARRRLELVLGKLFAELDPQPAGSSFGVLTQEGSIVAVGTAFSVEVPAAGARVVTRVLHGTVLAEGHEGAPQRVSAHHEAFLDGTPVRALSPAEESRERALLVAPLARPRASFDPDAPARATASVPREARVRAAKSAPAWLALAQTRRVQRDNAGALAAYDALLRQYPQSAEAHTAQVAYGELMLATGGDASVALAAFDRYLSRGGSLVEEATFGRIRALRVCGELRAERAAIEAFLRQFADSPLASSLRTRLRTLDERR